MPQAFGFENLFAATRSIEAALHAGHIVVANPIAGKTEASLKRWLQFSPRWLFCHLLLAWY